MSDDNVVKNDKVIRDLMDLVVDAVSYEGLAKRIVQMFARVLDAELCTLWREVQENDENKLVLSASQGFERRPGEEIPTYPLKWNAKSNDEIGGVTAWIAVRNQACIANSYEDLAENREKPWYGAHRGKWDNLQFMGGAVRKKFKSLLGLPIIYGDDQRVVGVIKAENSLKPGRFDAEDFKLAMRLLPFVGIALQSMTKREEHERERQQVLKDLTSTLPVLALTTYHQQVVDETAKLLNADICSLWLVTRDRRKLVLGANYGVLKKTQVPEYPLNWEAKDDSEIDGLTPWVAIRQKPFFASKFEDLKEHKAHRGKWNVDQWEGKPEENLGCLYAVPLLRVENTFGASKETIGVLKIENSRGKHVFNDVDKATFDVMADFISLAIELSGRLRSNIVFEFFHLLKQPTLNAINVFNMLRQEMSSEHPRQNNIQEWLELLAINLENVRLWTMQVYGLASAPSRQISDQPPLKTNLHQIFVNITRVIRMLFPDFNCKLSPNLKQAEVQLTELQLRKVEVIFFNILNNSYKYSNPPRKIEADAVIESRRIVVSVTDNGQGIAPEILPQIFEPFFTTSTSTSKWTESLGLGLSTVKNLLDELGWSCEVESTTNVGSRFSIVIPTSKEVPQE